MKKSHRLDFLVPCQKMPLAKLMCFLFHAQLNKLHNLFFFFLERTIKPSKESCSGILQMCVSCCHLRSSSWPSSWLGTRGRFCSGRFFWTRRRIPASLSWRRRKIAGGRRPPGQRRCRLRRPWSDWPEREHGWFDLVLMWTWWKNEIQTSFSSFQLYFYTFLFILTYFLLFTIYYCHLIFIYIYFFHFHK